MIFLAHSRHRKQSSAGVKDQLKPSYSLFPRDGHDTKNQLAHREGPCSHRGQHCCGRRATNSQPDYRFRPHQKHSWNSRKRPVRHFFAYDGVNPTSPMFLLPSSPTTTTQTSPTSSNLLKEPCDERFRKWILSGRFFLKPIEHLNSGRLHQRGNGEWGGPAFLLRNKAFIQQVAQACSLGEKNPSWGRCEEYRQATWRRTFRNRKTDPRLSFA